MTEPKFEADDSPSRSNRGGGGVANTDIPANPQLRAATDLVVRNVLIITVLLGVIAIVVSWFYSLGALASAVLATGTGVVLALITRALMRWAVKDLSMLSGAMVLDYLAKAVVVLAVVLVGKHLIQIDHRALGIVLLILIVAQSLVQLLTLMRAKIPTITPVNKDHD